MLYLSLLCVSFFFCIFSYIFAVFKIAVCCSHIIGNLLKYKDNPVGLLQVLADAEAVSRDTCEVIADCTGEKGG